MKTDTDWVRKQVVLDWLKGEGFDQVAGCFMESFDFWPEEFTEGPRQPRSLMVRSTDPGTSLQAAKDNYPRSGSQRHKVLMAIAECCYGGGSGASADEIEKLTGLAYRSMTPRIGELKRSKWIRPSGEKRMGGMGSAQEVLELTELGWSTMRVKEGLA